MIFLNVNTFGHSLCIYFAFSYSQEPVDDLGMDTPDEQHAAGGLEVHANALAALLGGANGNLPDMLDMSQDNDDEAMVGLAIALSLQEADQSNHALGLQGLSLPSASQVRVHFSVYV